MRQISLIFLFFAFIFTVHGQYNFDLNATIPLNPQVKKGTLSNGMTYYIMKNSKPAKRAEIRLAVKVGSTMENEDQQGLAHFTEHMCFNGTKNFPGNSAIKYFESKGIKFGRDLNAYTSFDETVYMLTVPTDSIELFQKALLLFEDWAHNLLETDNEIDKERGVITEEWRLGQGASERMRNIYWPVLYKNSRYAERLPIGKKEVIQNFKYETLRSFYHDWYRPDLMAIIVTGDIDVAMVENHFKKNFAQIPTVNNPRPLQKFDIPDHQEMLISKVTDKEATSTSIRIYYKHPPESTLSVSDIKRDLIYNIYNNMLNNRLSELKQQANPPFLLAYSRYGQMVKTKSSFTCFANVKEKGIMIGLESLITENERVKRYGFTATELERTKRALLRDKESDFAEKDKMESSYFANSLIGNFLDNDPDPGIAYELALMKKFLPEINLVEVNNLAKNLVTDGKNMVIVITGSEKAVIPSDSAIKALFESVKSGQLSPYIDNMITKPLMDNKPVASPVSKEKYIKELDITEYLLPNGLKVVLKPTDFKNDQVLLYAFSNGGTSLYPDDFYHSATYSSSIIAESGLGNFDYIQLQKFLKDKRVYVNPYISDLTEGFSGNASPQDLETMFQMIYLYFTEPHKDSIAFMSFIEKNKGALENRSASPQNAFYDTINAVLGQYNFRRMPMTLEKLKKVDFNSMYAIYQESFSDATGFTFFFVGNFDKLKIKPLIETYLGSLPIKPYHKTWIDLGIRPPEGMINKTLKKGIEPKSSVRFVFTGPFSWTWKDRMDINTLMILVNKRLRESIREEKGGTYGIRANANPSHFPYPNYSIYIDFGCNPARVDELSTTLLNEIDKIIKGGITDSELAMIKEQLVREREVSLKENNYWMRSIASAYQNEDNVLDMLNFNTYTETLKTADFIKFATTYFNMNNLAKFVLMPEK